MAVERVIGVDFGTSTSVVRVKRYDNGNPKGEKLETKEVVFGDSNKAPTLISVKDDDFETCYVGHEAKRVRKDYTQYSGFKMDLESRDPAVRARARRLTEVFLAYLAKQYRSQSEGGHLGNPDDRERTIISYPVKWTEETKGFMLEAAKKAGFPNVTGMDEAQAAIRAVVVMNTDHLQKHGLLKNGECANILLIDMGAGTTDLVLARYTPGEMGKTEVLNTWPKSGEILFGGKEIDRLLPNFLRNLLEGEDPDAVDKIFVRIGEEQYKSWKEESVSPTLRDKQTVNEFTAFDNCASMVGIYLDQYGLDCAAFEDCLADYLKQFPALVNGCLQDAAMSGRDVDLVIVTGGHSQWYFVNEMLCGKMPQFGSLDLAKIRENPARIVPISRPQETVALGLAYSGIPLDLSGGAVKEPEIKAKEAGNLGNVLNTILEQKKAQPIVEDGEEFRMKFDPAKEAFYLAGKGTVVVGTVLQGTVKTDETVYVCGGVGQSIPVRVHNIARFPEGKNINQAHAGDYVAILISGISAEDANRGTYIAGVPDDTVQQPASTASQQHRYVKQPAGRMPQEPVIKLDDIKNAAQKTVNTVRQTAEQLAEQRRQREIEEARRRMEAMQIDPDAIPLTPENEFEIGSVGRKDCSIKKYIGSRSVISIPPTIRGRKVVAIEDLAFGAILTTKFNRVLEVVIIPDTVTKIGYAAFNGCLQLRYVRARMVRDIGRIAFQLCGNLETADFGNSVVNISVSAFANCARLQTAVFGSNVEIIGPSAFYGCCGIRRMEFGMGDCMEGHVIFPPRLKVIGAQAFHKGELLHPTACIFKEIGISRRTKITDLPGIKCFNPKYCAVFYYD